MVITGNTSVINSSSVPHLIIMSIECLQRVLKRLGVLAELPDGTGEVTRACDEVAPSGIQGHAHYHSYKRRRWWRGMEWDGSTMVNQPCMYRGRLNGSWLCNIPGCASTYTTPCMPMRHPCVLYTIHAVGQQICYSKCLLSTHTHRCCHHNFICPSTYYTLLPCPPLSLFHSAMYIKHMHCAPW